MRIILAVSLVLCLLGSSLQRSKASLKSRRQNGLGHEWSGLTSNNSPSKILAVINYARTNPKGFAAQAKADPMFYTNGIKQRVPNCIPEAIMFLNQQKALPPFTFSEVFTLAAYQHSAYQAKVNKLTHTQDGQYKVAKDRVRRWTTQTNAEAYQLVASGSVSIREAFNMVFSWMADCQTLRSGHPSGIFSSPTHMGCAEVDNSNGYFITCVLGPNFPVNTGAPGYSDIKKAAGI